ncbi:hypothetical protein OROHE_014026 [Orobanche hederae]
MVMELLNHIPMETLILAIYTHTVSQSSIIVISILFFNSKNQIMARKVKKTSKGGNSSRQRNGGRTPVVEDASSPIREMDEQNYELQVSDDDDASRNEDNSTRPTSLAASPGREENLDSKDDELWSCIRHEDQTVAWMFLKI